MTNAPILPPTVVDQIRLWHMEGDRMESTPGFLIRDVGSQEEYEKAVEYASTLSVLVKEFPKKRWFFVTRMDQMQLYFKQSAIKRKEAKEAAESKAGRA